MHQLVLTVISKWCINFQIKAYIDDASYFIDFNEKTPVQA